MTSKPSDPAQRDRFIEKAREMGCDEDEERFNETLKRVVTAEPTSDKGLQKKPA
ncbi:MAG: hypothetical protein OYG32_05855 [Rhodospirillaceae bacterium]|nr:hypothetical protein [Rhodospirillaceae bacterium]